MWADSKYVNLSLLAPTQLGAAGERIFRCMMSLSHRTFGRTKKGENGDYRLGSGPVVENKFSLQSLRGGIWHWNHMNASHYPGVDLACLMGVVPDKLQMWFVPYTEAASYSDGKANKGPMSVKVDPLPFWLLAHGDGTFCSAMESLDRLTEKLHA